MKKMYCIICILVFTISAFCSVASGANLNLVKNASATDSVITYEVSEEEYIQGVSKLTNLPKDTIRAKLRESLITSSEAMGSVSYGFVDGAVATVGTLHYWRTITTKNFSSGTTLFSPVELGMWFTVYEYLSFRQINSIDACWTGAAASGPYVWNEYVKVTYPKSFPTIAIEAHARGAVETTVNVSVSGGVELKNALLGCGFSVTGQVGTIIYLRKVDDISLYYRVYY
ncbi:MAG: hypothetical protein Q8S19_08930 [Bacillota bacterium]|nr:hypothetical protein [Bacillota bacterium]